jgi:hypothetical protein
MPPPAKVRYTANAPFPALVTGIGPVAVNKVNGIWSVAFNMAPLAQAVPPFVNAPHEFFTLWNDQTGAFSKSTLADVLSQVSSISAQTFNTQVIAAATNIPNSTTWLQTLGFHTAGDRGGALYFKVVSNPGVGGFQSADGAWWALSVQSPNVKQFGARGDGVTVDTAAFNNCYSYCNANRVPMRILAGTYPVASLVFDQIVDVWGEGNDTTFLIPTANNQTVVYFNFPAYPGLQLHSTIISGGDFQVVGTGFTGIVGVRYTGVNTYFARIVATQCKWGQWVDGSQFCVFESLGCTRNSEVGLRLAPDSGGSGGGGNNNEFRTLNCYANQVGLMCGRTGMPFPFATNFFPNLMCQSNTLCGMWAIDASQFVVTCLEAEDNAGSGPTSAVIDGETITQSVIQAVDCTGISFIGYGHSQAGQVILAQGFSRLTFEDAAGANVQVIADDTASVYWDGFVGNASVLTNVLAEFGNVAGTAQLQNQTPELLREDQYFPNEVASPNYPPASSGTNCSATGLDTDQYGGLVATATFFASAGDVNTNRVTYLAAASTIGLTDDCFLAFFIQSNVNASFGSNGFQSVISPFFSLKAGVWTRIYAKNFNSTGFVRNQLYILWPQDSAGATVKITKMIFCRNLTQQQARLLGREHPFNPLDKQGSRAVLNAAPTTGTWKVGDIVWNSAPASAGYLGWVCTVAGTPGTWKTWGLIS